MSHENLDHLDKKIINCLNDNTRASYSEIAQKARTSKEVVNYRIKRLIERGIISEFVTIFNLGYWPNKIMIEFEKGGLGKEQEAIEYLKKLSKVTWITTCSGNADLIFVIMSKNPTEFDKYLREILSNIGQYILDYRVATGIATQTFGHRYILNKETEINLKQKSAVQNIKLDKKDKAIAKVLSNDARAKLIDICKATSLSIDIVRYRLKQMEANNIIKKYSMVINSSKLGFNRYQLFIRCIDLTESLLEKFRIFAELHQNVEYFSKSVGSWDIEFTVNYKSNAEFRDFVLEVKKEFGEHITKFETVSLFDTYKNTFIPEEIEIGN